MSSDSKICSDFQEQFDSLELGLTQLSKTELDTVNAHMDSCATCQTWLSDWELIQLRTHELTQLEVPSSVLKGVMSGLVPHTQLAPAIASAKRDWLISVAGMVALLVATVAFNSIDAKELGAWFVSFAVLFGINFLMPKNQFLGDPA